MEPRKEVLKKTPEDRKDEKKGRFQIVKLEERIAPSKGHHGGPPCWSKSPHAGYCGGY